MEVDHAKKFANLKASYTRKKRTGRISFQEEIESMSAKTAESARIKRQKADRDQSDGAVNL